MKYFGITFLLLFINALLFAQESFSIKGKVHKTSGEALSHITVKLVGTHLVAVSDQYGRYVFTSVPKGSYKLVVSSVEFDDKMMPLDVNKNYDDLHIHLDPRGDISLDEVTVSRKTHKKELETSGFAVAVIETKEASLRNLTTNELLDRAVGVRVRQNGGIGSQIEYNLNGMSGSAIGVFLDGTPISTFGSSFNLNNIPPAMIERIEVYKGVLPSHLTGDYVGGAINVIMKKDASANTITAAVSYGSFNTFQADLGLMYRDQRSGFTSRISGFSTYTDNNYEMWGKFAVLTDAEQRLQRYQRFKRFNNTYKSVGGRFEFGFTNVNWADQFMIGYNISDTYQEIPHGTTMAQPYVGRFQEFGAHVFSLNYQKKNILVNGLSLDVNAVYSQRSTYLQDTARAMYNWDGKPMVYIRAMEEVAMVKPIGQGQQGAATISNVDRNILNARTNLSYMIADGHKLSINHNINKTSRMDTDLLNLNDLTNTNIERNTSTNIFGFNYESQILSKKLRTNILGKYTINQNHYNNAGQNTTLTNSNPGYGMTLSYNVIPKLHIITSAENTFISPRDEQIFGNPESNILENLNLLPEKNVNFNLGFRYAPLKFSNHKLSLYANAFWRNGYDKIAAQAVDSVIVGRESDANIQTTKYTNLGRTQSRGFEAELTYVYKNKLNAIFNISKFNSVFKQEFDENGRKHFLYNRQLPNEPFFTMNGSVQYRLDNIVQQKSILNLYYNTGYVAPFSTVWIDSDEWFTTNTQFYHDFGASYQTPKRNIIVSLDLKNAFNSEIYDNFAVQKPGRAIYLKINYMLNNIKLK